MVGREEFPLVGMGVVLVVGAGVLLAATAGATPGSVDGILLAYGLFVVGFVLGAAHQYRNGNGVGAAGHLIAVVGWIAGIGGRATGDVRLAAFSLAALGASGIALLYLGVDSARVADSEPW